ncbi:putative bifunctional diguanylate cyclase/phosphodiesterase [Roseibium sp. M-1]
MTGTALTLPDTAVAMLFPLHVILDADGRIAAIGPTLERMFGRKMLHQDFFDVFKVERPRRLATFQGLLERLGDRLVVTTAGSDGDRIQFRAVAIALGDNDGRILVDLSFGIHLAKVVNCFGLTEADFKPNDFSIDLFYSFEAQRTLLEDAEKMAKALKAAKVEAERKASQDPLTGIANRGALYRRLEEILQVPDRSAALALLHIDLDDFKAINDTFGHAAGDGILLQTAAVLEAHAGPNDLPARLGGDEFVLVLADPPGPTGLKAFAHDLLAGISKPLRHNGHLCQVGASIGLIRFTPGDVQGADRLIAQSDIALYDAKAKKSSVKLLSRKMVARHEEAGKRVFEIETGLKANGFFPFFQPHIDAASGRIRAVEALARWERPGGAVLVPAQFMKSATRANLVAEIDRQVRQSAFARFAGWSKAGHDLGKLSLNVGVSSLRDREFGSVLTAELAEAGLSPDNIQLELSEIVLFERNDGDLADRCKDLASAGFALALDDCGRGRCAISSLMDTPVNLLKIDRTLITGVAANEGLQRIAGAMLAMAKTLGLDILAEGIETKAELDYLEARGCHLFQGHYFAAPASAADFEVWLNSRRQQLTGGGLPDKKNPASFSGRRG